MNDCTGTTTKYIDSPLHTSPQVINQTPSGNTHSKNKSPPCSSQLTPSLSPQALISQKCHLPTTSTPVDGDTLNFTLDFEVSFTPRF